VRLEKVSLLRNVLSIFREAFFVYGPKKIPSPWMGEGEALHHVGCRTKALNLTWFRGGGEYGNLFTFLLIETVTIKFATY